jgi:RNA polymerase sigma-70 factor, ECF subfamily
VGATSADLEALYRERYLGFRRALAPVAGSYEDAHDAVQEGFAIALRERRKFRGDAPLGAWVWRITLRAALRSKGGRQSVPLEDVLDVHAVEPVYDPELFDAMRELPNRRRTIFFLRYFGGFSYREIAAICEIDEGTVAASLSSARKALAERLDDNAELPCREGSDER